MRAVQILPILLVFLSACDAHYTDVSDTPEYSEHVGWSCKNVKPFYAYGYAEDLNDRTTDRLALYAEEMASRAFHTFAQVVPIGSSITIDGVRECWNCPFDRIEYEVSIRQNRFISQYHMHLSERDMEPENIQCAEIDATRF